MPDEIKESYHRESIYWIATVDVLDTHTNEPKKMILGWDRGMTDGGGPRWVQCYMYSKVNPSDYSRFRSKEDLVSVMNSVSKSGYGWAWTDYSIPTIECYREILKTEKVEKN